MIINLIIFCLFFQVSPNHNLNLFEYKLSKITLKIKGIGYKNIFGNETNYSFSKSCYPNEIIINGEKQNIIYHSYDFNQTDNFVELIWNNSIKSCWNMFRRSYDITEIDLSNFDTSQIINMGGLFLFCSSLTSINFGNFDTSKVTAMHVMFSGCSSLTSINLSTFNTSQVLRMEGMFKNCLALTSLNVSNFDTSQVTEMYDMFYNCPLLTSLNLSNFIISNVTNMKNLFSGCTNLSYINLENFDGTKLLNYTNLFYRVPDNAVICIDENNSIDKILTEFKKRECYNIDCSENWKFNPRKIISENGTCIYSCIDSQYKYEYNGTCYDEIKEEKPSTTLSKISDSIIDLSNDILYKKIFSSFLNNTNVEKGNLSNEVLEVSTLAIKESIPKIIESDILQNFENNTMFNIETDTLISIKKYSSIDLNNNTDLLKNTEKNTVKGIIEEDSLINIENDTLQSIENNSLGNKEKEINKTFLNIETFQTILQPESHNKNNNYNYNSSIIYPNEDNYKTNFVITGNNDEVYQEIIDNVINKYDISKGEEMVFKGEDNCIFYITNSQNELDLLKGKNNNTNKCSIIDLGECENLLKKHYQINENVSLIIIKFEKVTNISSEKSLQYEVYEPFQKTKLNLSICDKITIDIYIPLVLSEKIQNLYDELKNMGYELYSI